LTWYFKEKEFKIEDIEEGVIGFVYLITNLKTERKYIGKKRLIRSFKTRATKKKKAKRVKEISNWMDYYGSSAELLRDIEFLGKENFRRDILYLCASFAEMSYLEIKEQIDNEVLFREDFYNKFIGCRINANHLKLHNKKNLTLSQ